MAKDERNFVCVNADKSAEVPCDSPEAAYRFRADDAEYKKMMAQHAKATKQDAEAVDESDDEKAAEPAENKEAPRAANKSRKAE